MANGVGLPPDIVAQQNKQTRGGIGGSAGENSANAVQRVAAMDARAPLVKEDMPTDAPAVEEDKVKPEEVCPSTRCGADVETDWNFCPICKTDLLHGGAAKKIGITLGEKDLSDYLFKGFITRDIKVLGKYKMTLKTSQPKDLEEIDTYIMNGDWAKKEDGSDRKISDFYMRQMNAMCMTAAAMVDFNGEAIGETLESKVDWLRERGSELVDILSTRVSLFNRSIAEFLQEEDTVLKS